MQTILRRWESAGIPPCDEFGSGAEAGAVQALEAAPEAPPAVGMPGIPALAFCQIWPWRSARICDLHCLLGFDAAFFASPGSSLSLVLTVLKPSFRF